ncbi:hypothetical protein LZZ85_23215, partial [Terrimonas sp. NA20]
VKGNPWEKHRIFRENNGNVAVNKRPVHKLNVLSVPPTFAPIHEPQLLIAKTLCKAWNCYSKGSLRHINIIHGLLSMVRSPSSHL